MWKEKDKRKKKRRDRTNEFSERVYLGGASSAAYQLEGAYKEDGKGPGIWDALSDGHVKRNENGNKACDHYH